MSAIYNGAKWLRGGRLVHHWSEILESISWEV